MTYFTFSLLANPRLENTANHPNEDQSEENRSTSQNASRKKIEKKFKEEVRQRFLSEYEGISFFGISSAKSIKPYVGLTLVNLGLQFRKQGMFLSANEVELATALAFANEKKVS